MAAVLSTTSVFDVFNGRSLLFKKLVVNYLRLSNCRKCQAVASPPGATVPQNSVEFGLFFDIDGVITRGRTLLPHSKTAFQLLTDDNGRFLVPSIFVTNAGNTLRQSKAKQLSDWLGIQVHPDQVIMSHSPLRMFRQFLDRHVLVSGQGPVESIAANLGFNNITTLDKFRQCFPLLDAVDHQRRKAAPCAFEKYFPKIEAVVLFGEPVRWETTLQLIIDVLVSNGRPSEVVSSVPYPHIPVLACNMDLVWMSEAPMPRFGHGCFMHCLESLYKKITGFELKYTALVGKPSEITYHYAERVLQIEANKMKLPRLRRMYCIGDNPDTDIYGANLFNRNIQKKREKMLLRKSMVAVSGGGGGAVATSDADGPPNLDLDMNIEQFDSEGPLTGIDQCESILVCTGVYNSASADGSVRVTSPSITNGSPGASSSPALAGGPNPVTGHAHRDFVMDAALCQPSMTTVHNVEEAVRSVFEKERINHMLLRR